MKKIFTIILVLTVITALAFADKNRFYENGNVIDTMYVASLEGLRIRSTPDLKGKKINAIPYMIQVKVTAIGKETIIDGIKDPWVEILVPRYLWKGEEPEYGWVFGGYLTDKRDNLTEMPLELRLQVHNWDCEWGNKMKLDFCSKGFDSRTFNFSYDLRNDFRVEYYGNWTVKENILYLEGKQTFYEDGCIVVNSADYKVELTEEDIRVGDAALRLKVFPFTGCPEIEMPREYRSLLDSDTMEELKKTKVMFFAVYTSGPYKEFRVDFSKPYIYYQAWCDYGDERDSYCSPLIIFSDDENYKHLISQLIASGVDPRLSKYVKDYREYWDPIMKEHQKKADEIK